MAGDASRAALGVQKILPAYRQVSDQLRDRILGGDLPAGSRLPNETEMSAMFGVSRSTVREALRVLSSQNLVTTSRGVGGGTFVARPEPEQVAQYLEASLGLLSASEDVTVSELLEFRGLLEVPSAGLAAERRTDDDLEVLRETLHVESEGSFGSSAFEGHRAFHQTVLEASGNGLLEMVTRPIFTTLRTRFLRDNAPVAFWQQVAEEHLRIFRCIEERDVDGARHEMQVHLDALAKVYEGIDRRRAAG
jgi:GntR family transcriptional regulator, transcriptional repressor for pyruvate dehydrogenase complex